MILNRPGEWDCGSSCTVTVQFAPASAGTVTATLTAANNKHTVLASDALTGTGASPGHLYWTDPEADTIYEASLDGASPRPIVTGQNGPSGMALDSSHIYWADDPSGTIMRASLDGTGVTPRPAVWLSGPRRHPRCRRAGHHQRVAGGSQRRPVAAITERDWHGWLGGPPSSRKTPSMRIVIADRFRRRRYAYYLFGAGRAASRAVAGVPVRFARCGVLI